MLPRGSREIRRTSPIHPSAVVPVDTVDCKRSRVAETTCARASTRLRFRCPSKAAVRLTAYTGALALPMQPSTHGSESEAVRSRLGREVSACGGEVRVDEPGRVRRSL
jgi:hypothetical protein